MNDLSYRDALERAPIRREVILGPAPCHRCGAWVEWAGVRWLALGTDEPHECWPYLQAHPMPEVVAEWTRPTEPRWMRTLGAGILWVAFFLAAAFAVLLVAKRLAGEL